MQKIKLTFLLDGWTLPLFLGVTLPALLAAEALVPPSMSEHMEPARERSEPKLGDVDLKTHGLKWLWNG